MKCTKPIITKNTDRRIPIPCGQCISCRIKTRHIWTHRQILENITSDTASFLTLTYSDENLPSEFMDHETGEIYAKNSVLPADHKKFMDHLRTVYRRKYKKNLRYFMCAEYGEKTGRPHYHYVLFGYPPCEAGSRIVQGSFVPCQCKNCSFLHKVWKKGNIFLGSFSKESAQYVAGYVQKKLTRNICKCGSGQHHPKCSYHQLQGRHPEFARQSRNPGLGLDYILDFASRIKPFVNTYDDVPTFITHDGKKFLLGKYLTEKLYEALELPPLSTEEKISKYEEKLQTMLSSEEALDKIPQFSSLYINELFTMLNHQHGVILDKKQLLSDTNKKGNH